MTDWNQVRERVEKIAASLKGGHSLSPGEKRKILKERAKAVAKEPAASAPLAERLEILEFLLAYERYGLESTYVHEVYPMKEFTPLPHTPRFVLGIMNIRGRILSVIDVKRFFDLPEKGLTDLNKVIIVRMDDIEIGILADVILGVRQVALDEIQPSLPALTGIRTEYLKGVTQDRLVILDGKKILLDKNIRVQQDA